DNLTLEDPHFHTDDAVSSAGLCSSVINVSAQSVQRHTTFAVPFTASDLCTTQTATDLNLDTFGALTHGVLYRALHGTTEHHTTLQFLGNALSNQHSIQIRLANFFDVDMHRHTHLLADISAQLVNIFTFLTNHNTWTGSV